MFIVLGRDYFKDKNRVYYNGEIILTAQPSNLEVLSEDYAKDSRAVFYKLKRLRVHLPPVLPKILLQAWVEMATRNLKKVN